MKKKIFAVFILLAVILSLEGCTSTNRKDSEHFTETLLASGFIIRVPTTSQEQAVLRSLQPQRLLRVFRNQEVFYVYADPVNCSCAYVGGEKEYAVFMRLSFQRQIDDDSLVSPELTERSPDAWWW